MLWNKNNFIYHYIVISFADFYLLRQRPDMTFTYYDNDRMWLFHLDFSHIVLILK